MMGVFNIDNAQHPGDGRARYPQPGDGQRGWQQQHASPPRISARHWKGPHPVSDAEAGTSEISSRRCSSSTIHHICWQPRRGHEGMSLREIALRVRTLQLPKAA